MDESELSLTLGSNWLAQARAQDPEGYLVSAWRLYTESPDEILESALLSELSTDLRLAVLELRVDSEQARQVAPEDLMRSGLLALQLALSSLPHLDWLEVRGKALELAQQAMERRLSRPSPR